jgi:hypothetical protein
MRPEEKRMKELLFRLQPPPESEPVRAAALSRAQAAMCGGRVERRSEIRWWAVALVPAAICAVALVAVLSGPSAPPVEVDRPDTAEVGRWIAEIEELFHGQLDAVVAEGTRVELKLRDVPVALPTDQGIEMEFFHAGKKCRMFTFSGRRVCLAFEGRSLCVTPLIQGDGSVIVMADDQVILPFEVGTLEGIRVSARFNPGFSS